MCTYIADVMEEIMELLREKVVEQLDVLVRHEITFRPEEFCSLSESGRLAKIVRDCRKMEHKRKHSSDESEEEASTIKRTRNSTSTSTTEDSSSYDEIDDGREIDPLNIVIVTTYQTTECQTDPAVKQDASTQTDDVMI